MDEAIINRVEVLSTGELFLGIEGSGCSDFQHVYREAAGVYWDPVRVGFKSTPMKELTCSQWYLQIVAVAKSGVGVRLSLSKAAAWKNVPEQEVEEIQRNAI